jgi:hypothetical protein
MLFDCSIEQAAKDDDPEQPQVKDWEGSEEELPNELPASPSHDGCETAKKERDETTTYAPEQY